MTLVEVLLLTFLVLSVIGNLALWHACNMMYNKGKVEAYSEVLAEINNTIQTGGIPSKPPVDFGQ